MSTAGLGTTWSGNSSAMVLSRSILIRTSRARIWLGSVDRWLLGAERHKAAHEEREDRHLVGSGGGTGFFYHKRFVSEALMGVVLGSGNWSRDSRGARGSSAEEPDID